MTEYFWRATQPAAIDREFSYHAPSEAAAAVHEHVRAMLRTTAHRLNEMLPECEPKKAALAYLRAAMWAGNAAVACYGNGDRRWQESVGDWLTALPVHVDEELVDDVLAAAAAPTPVDPADCLSAWHFQREQPSDRCPECGVDVLGNFPDDSPAGRDTVDPVSPGAPAVATPGPPGQPLHLVHRDQDVDVVPPAVVGTAKVNAKPATQLVRPYVVPVVPGGELA